MNRLIIALGLITIWVNLAQAQSTADEDYRDEGPSIAFEDAGTTRGCLVDRISCGEQSCELHLEMCELTLDQCRTARFYVNADDEEGADVLGCGISTVDVDKEEAGL